MAHLHRALTPMAQYGAASFISFIESYSVFLFSRAVVEDLLLDASLYSPPTHIHSTDSTACSDICDAVEELRYAHWE